MIKRFYKVICKISSFLTGVSSVALIAVLVVTLINVVSRSIGSGLLGSYDFVIVTIVIVISLVLADTGVKDGHVAIGVLVDRLPKKVQKVIDLCTYVVALIVLIMTSTGIWQHSQALFKSRDNTATIHIPFAPFVVVIFIGVSVLCLVILGKILNLFVKEGAE